MLRCITALYMLLSSLLLLLDELILVAWNVAALPAAPLRVGEVASPIRLEVDGILDKRRVGDFDRNSADSGRAISCACGCWLESGFDIAGGGGNRDAPAGNIDG